MPDSTVIAGIVIPSTSPLFLAGVGVHVGAGLVCVAAGALAMLSRKRRGRHSTAGTVYFWGLAVLCASAAVLAVVRWPEDNVLLALVFIAFGAAYLGRQAMRSRHAVRLHITGMGASYIVMLTAFYVDNGKFLPLWRDLSPLAYWLVPAAIGLPIMGWALLRHPLVRGVHLQET
ncbi:MAG TPA: hypothetical protein VLI41_04775 [Phenylobacterium sp.]|uniref:hypothetical protein n=1 Tax=Phenylobacterium sp. TaxID=1871053 RepID=UPI002BDB25D6|nr:hypothetical protein [Phenylobacterium sp.]HSV02499.1 hypothetical protein [Phenylobacterium sp.]